jgi:hypothetical protein
MLTLMASILNAQTDIAPELAVASTMTVAWDEGLELREWIELSLSIYEGIRRALYTLF